MWGATIFNQTNHFYGLFSHKTYSPSIFNKSTNRKARFPHDVPLAPLYLSDDCVEKTDGMCTRGTLLLCSVMVFRNWRVIEPHVQTLNLIHLYASRQMCPSEFSALWGSDHRSFHAVPSWFAEEKKRQKEKVGHTDGISSSPPCQPLRMSLLRLLFHRGSDCSCSVLGTPPIRFCMLSATFHPPLTSDLWPLTPSPPSPLPEDGRPSLCSSGCHGSLFLCPIMHFLPPPPHTSPVCVMSTLECVCVHANSLCSGVWVCVSCDLIPACSLHRLFLT